jgi:type IV secretion system protein VirB9
MMLIKTTLAAALAVATLGIAHSVKAQSLDARIQYENYSPDKVYVVRSSYGKSALIQLEAGETLDGASNSVFGSGDQKAWNFGIRGNNITFKPLEKDPDTNLILVSNRRTYAFDLKLAKEGEPLTYILRFHYLDTMAAKQAAIEAKIAETALELEKLKQTPKQAFNTDYTYRGSDTAILPTSAWDNGLFTFFQYASASALPVAYKLLPDGKEAIVNSHIEGDTLVLHELANTFVLRLGDAVLEVYNKKMHDGVFNESGTSSRVKRVDVPQSKAQ